MPIKHLKTVSDRPRERRVTLKSAGWKPLLSSLGLLLGSAALIGFFFLTLAMAWLSRGLPDPNALLTREVPQSTKIYDRTGETLLYEIHGEQKRTLVKLEDIPDSIKWATIAVEDRDFYKHHGINWLRLLKAVYTNIVRRRLAQGASTLTQQLVKNAILTNERSVTRKLKEAILAIQIERKYTKDQILQMYLNEIPYGSTLYGIEAASRGYFGKSSKELALDEAALLAALPQAPDFYNPYGLGSRGDNRVSLVRRQKFILDRMVEQGYVAKEAAEEAKKAETLKKLVPKRVGDIKAPHFVMWVREQLVEKYGQKTVEQGGLKVVTTLDWRLQQAAENAVKAGVEKRGAQYKFTNAALVALGPKDGQVLAMVGSKDFFDEEHDGQVNVALRPRQPGSSFKPIVYAAGFMKGYLPETTLWDVNTTFKTEIKNYSPKDYDQKERGPVSIRQALQGSLNIPAVKMIYLVGVGRVLDLAEQMGYSTFGDRSRFGLSLVLGGGEVKLLEHAAAYGVFATEGMLQPAASILKVEDAQGKTLEEWKLGDGKRVFDAQIARLISNVLSDNAARAFIFGAGNALTLPDRPVAAKTGTTNNYRDAWTVGYTPSLAAGVWVGNMDNTEMKRGADGSVVAAPIWQQFMKEAVKDSPKETFTPPAAPDTAKPALLGKSLERKIKLDKITGKLATEFTPPDMIEERPFYEAHSILFYVDKDDPRGPAPSNPALDPQFNNWESAVQAWVTREQWHTTSTPPTETDDVHTAANVPQVSISSPAASETLTSRQFTVLAGAFAPRRIVSFTAKMEGFVLGANYDLPAGQAGGAGQISALIPNAIEKGFHDLIIEARDDVGNTGKAAVTVNLLADPAPLSITVTDPAPGSSVDLSSFPKSVTVTISDLSNIKKADLYMQTPQGAVQLIGSSIKPAANPIAYTWPSAPGLGIYTLYIVTTDENGGQMTGDKINVTVK